MKIAQILTSHGEGGLEKHVRELTIALSEQGHELVVLAPATFLDTLPNSITKAEIPAHLSRNHPWLLWQVFRQLKKYHPEIIHAQANKAVSVLAKLRRFFNVPCVGTIHNIKKRNQVFNKMDHIIAVSGQLAANFDHNHVTTIYNGITLKTPSPINIYKTFALAEKQATFCAVGRLVTAKGFDLLIHAISDIDINLLIIGDGPDKTALQQLITEKNLSSRVKLIGFRSDATDIMNACDGVIISSRREGFSYVFSEAIVLNKPVLATNVPVANELLPAHLIVPTDNIEALRSAILKCLLDPDEWQQNISALHHDLAQELSITSMCNKTLLVYKQVID